MRIGIDIDNVITNTNEYLIEKAKIYNVKNNITNESKENPTSISDMYSWTKESHADFNNKYLRIMNQEVDCKNGARQILRNLKEDGNEIILITRRGNVHYSDCREITINWLEKNKIIYDDLITDVYDKGEECIRNHIDVFIDDEPIHCKQVSEKGIKVFMFDSMFNKQCNDYDRVNNWDELYISIVRNIL